MKKSKGYKAGGKIKTKGMMKGGRAMKPKGMAMGGVPVMKSKGYAKGGAVRADEMKPKGMAAGGVGTIARGSGAARDQMFRKNG
tara:strand:- start:2051 stop:2302 length:252 start_codon:yes stop_codon:yes gene_type:complete